MPKKIHFGLAQWRHPQWYLAHSPERSLELYASSFSSVEGNSSFYALPSKNNLITWQNTVSEEFRFCFKFPKEISHKLTLSHCSRQVSEFLNRISILNHKLGVIWLQLDQYCDGAQLSKIMSFIRQLPDCFNYAIEVRHLDYFVKGDIEKRFNEFLINTTVNRVIFDTRSLFALQNKLLAGQIQASDLDASTLESFSAKPKVPTNVIATGQHPFVRIIIPNERVLGDVVIKQWLTKVVQWLDAGLVPYVFFHTPNNVQAPEFAAEFSRLLQERYPSLEVLYLWRKDERQTSLF